MKIEQEFILKIQERLNQLRQKGDKALSIINDKDINWKPDIESNSIAIIVKHISSNMLSRWTDFYTSDGEIIWRNRDGEFEGEISSKEELIKIWNDGWYCFNNIVNSLKDEDLLKTIIIDNKQKTVINTLIHHLEHYAYHIGQLIYLCKHLSYDRWESLSISKKVK